LDSRKIVFFESQIMNTVLICLTRVLRLDGHFSRALACVGILALAATSAIAANENLSTGLDSSNALITIGNTPDAHWTVDQVSGGTAPARVVTSSDADGAYIGSFWASNGPSSNWIAIDATTSQNAPFIPVTYYRTFTLTAADLATATISGKWGIDDGGDLRLNGNLVSSLLNDYSASTPFLVPTGSSFFVAGTNTLTITMTFSDNAYEAVRLEGRLSQVPEPGALSLLLSGTIGLLSRRRARR
jgi:hypothetical protein